MILVVDDDEDVREMVRIVLETRGYHVRVADSGAAALEVLATERPCLMFLDLVMPGVDGQQVIAELGTRGLDVPVCVISALGENLPTNVVATLRKPFALGDLVVLAERYCSPDEARG